MLYAPVYIDKCHWGMMVVSIRKKYIRCYDSLAYDCKKYIMAMAKYIEQEWKHEYKNTINVTEQNGWEFQDTPNMLKNKINIPQQDNIYDCGVFGLMYADFLTQDKSLDFSISDIEAMRYRVLYSIVSGELTNAGLEPPRRVSNHVF